MRVFTWLVFQDQLGVTDHPDTVWISGWCLVLPRCTVHIVVSVSQSVSLPSYVFLYVQTPSVYAMMYIGPCSVCTRCMQVCTQCMQVCTRCMQVYTECMQVCTRCMQVHTECMQVSTRSVSNSVSLYTNICSSVICVVNIENFDVLSQWRMDLICRPDH